MVAIGEIECSFMTRLCHSSPSGVQAASKGITTVRIDSDSISTRYHQFRHDCCGIHRARRERVRPVAEGTARRALESQSLGLHRPARPVRGQPRGLESLCESHPEKGEVVWGGPARDEGGRLAGTRARRVRRGEPCRGVGRDCSACGVGGVR